MAKANKTDRTARQTVNEQLLHRAIRHAVFIECLKVSETRAAMKILNKDVLPDLMVQIEGTFARIASGKKKLTFADSRLKAVKSSITSILDGGMTSLTRMMQSRLVDLAASEAGFQLAAFDSVVTLPFDFVSPSPATLRAVVTAKPFEGRILSDWFSGIAKGSRSEIIRQLNIGMVQDESIPQMVSRIRGTASAAFGDGTAGKIRRDVESVVRTAVGHVSNHAREATYQANEDVVTGAMIVATLDTRTCESCMAEDGNVYSVGSGPRPSFHFSCRCTTAPVLKSWDELGIKAKEIDAGTRASMNGQVPASMTYGEWLQKQTKAVQNEALGPKRAELFRSGKVAIDRFVDDRNRPLTLKQIRDQEGL